MNVIEHAAANIGRIQQDERLSYQWQWFLGESMEVIFWIMEVDDYSPKRKT
jgi:hypothetical protein